MDNEKPSIIVAVRIRPENEKERHNFSSRVVVRAVDEQVLVFDPAPAPGTSTSTKGLPNHYRRPKDVRYAFDRVFDGYASQEEVYMHTAKTLVDPVLNGFNATVFAYGATGAGKTHTMIGSSSVEELELDGQLLADPLQPPGPGAGVMVRTMRDLFLSMQQQSDLKIFDVSISYMEIYNETIRDLLVDNSPALELREDTKEGVVVAGLSRHCPTSPLHVLQMLHRGNLRRAQSPTEANQTSSRSHAVLQVISCFSFLRFLCVCFLFLIFLTLYFSKITVRQKDRAAGITAAVKIGKLSLIDLAGSERAAVTKVFFFFLSFFSFFF
jgi:kinesin family protein 18/19